MAFHPPKPTPKGLWRRTPPAIFPATLGLLGLALGWRRGVGQFALPPGLADLFLGAVVLFALFALLTYVVKLMRRPAVGLEDLRILPGRAGLAAAVLCIYLLALAFGPISPAQARPILLLGIVAHLALTVAVLWTFAHGPAEQRRVNPVWHLTFSGWIVAALAAQGLGLATLALALFWLALLAALVIWSLSIGQFAQESVPAPLRPLLAIHLAPASLLGTVATGFNAGGLSLAFAALSVILLALFVVRARWLLAAGFSPLWGALTFPLASTASFWLALGGAWTLPGAVLLVAATVIIVPIALQITKLWAKGTLAIKTNAAIA